MNPVTKAWMRLVCVLLCATVFGCRSTGPNHMPTEQERLDMLSLMLPQRIRIEPFTKIKSFNEDEIPDGVLMVVRAFDKFGDPVKAIGLWYFELWTYEKASGDIKGQRVAFWERNMTTTEEVRLYWTRAQMYEFQLAWAGGVAGLEPGRKFVLTATYRAPWDETFQDQYVLEFQLPPGVLQPPAGESAGSRKSVSSAPGSE